MSKRRKPLPIVFVLVATAALLAVAGSASARPLTHVPPQLLDQARQPCVLYGCAGNPRLHLDWLSSVSGLRTGYCRTFPCSPMDLLPDNGLDDNLFPLNPDWGHFVQTGQTPNALQLCGGFADRAPLGSPPCTTQPVDLDGPGSGTAASVLCPQGRSPSFGSFHGHVNWEPATYDGTLNWESHSGSGEDDDYSLRLRTVGGHGATSGKPGELEIEFDSDETIDHFDSSTWWKRFHDAVDHSDSLAGRMVDGRSARVTGLVGLDTAHTPSTESHPVYALALRAEGAVTSRNATWAFFARSWGNEGYCSDRRHTLPRGPLTIRIPWLTVKHGRGPAARQVPASGVKITGTDDVWTNVESGNVRLSVLKGEGVLLTFDLSTSTDNEPLYWGTLRFEWTFASPPSKPARSSAVHARAAGEDSDVERLAAPLWRRLPRKTRGKALAHLPHLRIAPRHKRVRPATRRPPAAPLRRADPFVNPRPDRVLIALGKAQRRALCRAYRNRVPGYPTFCKAARRR